MADILDFLFATPYTPIAAQDRSGDLLAWSRTRRQLQRKLFPPFTVLTPIRTSAEARLMVQKLLSDPDLKAAFLTKNRLENLRHMDILFGLASLTEGKVKNVEDLAKAAKKGNPGSILNIERVQQYLDNRLQSGKSTLCFSTKANDYLANCAYGIGPHYSALLREFDLVNENGTLSPEGNRIVPVTNGNSIAAIRRIAERWGDRNEGVSIKDLNKLYEYVWEPIQKEFDARTALWLSAVHRSRRLSNTLFPSLCKIVEKIAPAASSEELKWETYKAVFSSNEDPALRACLGECRIFEVVTALADFLLYSLVVYSDPVFQISAEGNSAVKTQGGCQKLSAFVEDNFGWLPEVVKRLGEAIGKARQTGLHELHFPDLTDLQSCREPTPQVVTNVLCALLQRHKLKKGSQMTYVDYHEEAGDIWLTRSERQLNDLEDASKLQDQLREKMQLPELMPDDIQSQSMEGVFDADALWKDFIGGNFLWPTFGRWFSFIQTPSNDAAGA